MRILILANNDVGLYQFRKELLDRLLSDNHKVFISLPTGDRISSLVEMGCVFMDTPISRRGTNPFSDMKLILNYMKIIKRIKPDIVFSYTVKPNIYGGMTCELLKVPYVVNITGLGTAVEGGGLLHNFTVFLYKIALKKAKRVFFQNKENMQFFISEKIALRRHKLLPGSGVNLEKYSYMDYPDKKKIEFVYISRIMKEKGIDQYLEAAKKLRKKFPDTIFHVCGFCEETYEEKLKELHEQGVIVYHGLIHDVKGFLKDIHCVVHPTYYPEGMSNVLLEASACGRPIITTNRSGCKEVINDGKNGYIVEQKNSEDLIQKIEKFIQLPYEEKKQMGIYGREKVEREFDRNIVIDAYLNELTV